MNEQSIYKSRAEKALSFYSNLEVSLKEKLQARIISADPINVGACVQVIKAELGYLSPVPKSKALYWTQLGHSIDVADKLSFLAKQNLKTRVTKNVSPFSVQFWTTKINPRTNEFYTEAEADLERNARRPIRSEYWIQKGLSVEEAELKAKGTKEANNKSGAKASAERGDNIIRRTTKRCAEYWLAKGYNEVNAQEQVSKHQVTFSLNKLIEKHGEELGRQKWKTRQDKWQDTLKAKPLEERLRINKAKVGSGGVSSQERELFKLLEKHVECLKTQICLSTKANKRGFVFDLGLENKLIEYNGDYWHANPKKYSAKDVIKVTGRIAQDIWQRDAEKVKWAEDQGYEVLTIWESDFKQNRQGVVKQCLDFLIV